jgi:myo-inositol 2-dehydrogenase / D-chiro-inositol 1-dehydrogenase
MITPMRLRVGIVGCGRMGRERAAAATALGAKIVAAVDADAGAAQRLAADFRACGVAEDADDLAWRSLDAVFVCTPPSARGTVELAAIAERVPLFIEKPVGLSREQCLPVEAALEGRPCINAVGYMNRYRRSVEAARRRLATRTILGVSCNWVSAPYRVPWWNTSGGGINDLTTHLVDMARYLVGEIDHVQGIASSSPDRETTVEAASFNLRFATGQPCSMLYSCRAASKMVDFRVFTSDGTVHLRGWDFRLVGGGMRPDVDRSAIFRREVAAFFDAVRSGRDVPIRCDFSDALRTQAVVDALRRSLQSGGAEPVPV